MLPSKYEDNTLQIKEKSTGRTAPFFVLEVTARSAADILHIQPNSAILFYRKIRRANLRQPLNFFGSPPKSDSKIIVIISFG